MMQCIHDGARMSCIETRSKATTATTTRRYQCPECGARFTTQERFASNSAKGRALMMPQEIEIDQYKRRLIKSLSEVIEQFDLTH
jgi:transcriptional regulator NrdR family protein